MIRYVRGHAGTFQVASQVIASTVIACKHDAGHSALFERVHKIESTARYERYSEGHKSYHFSNLA